MRKKILAFVFAAALMMALAVPLFDGVGTALAMPMVETPPMYTPGLPREDTGVPASERAVGSMQPLPTNNPGIPIAASHSPAIMLDALGGP